MFSSRVTTANSCFLVYYYYYYFGNLFKILPFPQPNRLVLNLNGRGDILRQWHSQPGSGIQVQEPANNTCRIEQDSLLHLYWKRHVTKIQPPLERLTGINSFAGKAIRFISVVVLQMLTSESTSQEAVETTHHMSVILCTKLRHLRSFSVSALL